MRGGRRAAEGPGGTEVATAANINSTRRSEKVKVLGENITEGSEAAGPENVRAHVYIQAQTTRPRQGPRIHKLHSIRGLTNRRIHCSVEVTK